MAETGTRMLREGLIHRLSVRAANPETRTDAPDLDALLAETNVVTIETPLGAVTAAHGLNNEPHSKPAPAPLAAPASPEDIADAETRLGFPLPDDLKQAYGAIANGGFGPGSGLIPLDEVAAYHAELTAHPPGEGGQPWPVQLLPFNRYDLGCDCYDIESGEIVFWDEESLADGPDDSVWKNAFKTTAPGLSDYFKAWLDTAPPGSNERYVAAADVGFPDSDVMIDMMTVNHLRRSIEDFRQSPETLELFGLPKQGWEIELCNIQGLDPEIYLEMIKRPAPDEA